MTMKCSAFNNKKEYECTSDVLFECALFEYDGCQD